MLADLRVELLPDRGDVFVPHRTVLSGRFDRVAWSFPGESIRQHNCTPHDEDHAEYDDLEPRVAVRPEYRVERWVKQRQDADDSGGDRGTIGRKLDGRAGSIPLAR